MSVSRRTILVEIHSKVSSSSRPIRRVRESPPPILNGVHHQTLAIASLGESQLSMLGTRGWFTTPLSFRSRRALFNEPFSKVGMKSAWISVVNRWLSATLVAEGFVFGRDRQPVGRNDNHDFQCRSWSIPPIPGHGLRLTQQRVYSRLDCTQFQVEWVLTLWANQLNFNQNPLPYGTTITRAAVRLYQTSILIGTVSRTHNLVPIEQGSHA